MKQMMMKCPRCGSEIQCIVTIKTPYKSDSDAANTLGKLPDAARQLVELLTVVEIGQPTPKKILLHCVSGIDDALEAVRKLLKDLPERKEMP